MTEQTQPQADAIALDCSSVTDHYVKCESPAEVNLLHLLGKAGVRIEQQVRVGRYRIDAVTGSDTFAELVPTRRSSSLADVCGELLRVLRLKIPQPAWCPQVGWEVDGKQWHNESRDAIRDKWILANSDIKQIVRIPAAALLFYRDACLCGLATQFPAFSRFHGWVRSIDDRLSEADRIAEEIDDGHYDASIADEFAEGECCRVVGQEIHVGSPIAFLPQEHPLLNYVSRLELNRWIGVIVIR